MSIGAQSVERPSELLAGGMVKGSMMAAHIGWAVNDHRPDEVLRFWNAMPADIQTSVRGMILPVSWYEFAHLIAVDRAIVKVYGGGDPSILRAVGAQSAKQNLAGVYKAFRRESIHEFLDNGARLHPRFQDFGDVAYVKTSPTSGHMVHSAYRSYSPLFCESALGFYREALQLHGARNVDVDETTCQCRGLYSCTFAVRWR